MKFHFFVKKEKKVIPSNIMNSLTPNLMVHDVAKTFEFYQEILGAEMVSSVPEEAPFDWAMIRMEEIVLMFQASKSMKEEFPQLNSSELGGSFTLYMTIKGIESFYHIVKDKVEIISNIQQTFYGNTEFTFKDLNGYLITIAERGNNN